MPAPRFFCPTPLQAHTTIELPAATAHHALRALRLAHGDAVILFDGRGGQYPATLSTSSTAPQASTGAHEPIECELQGRIHLIQGIASGDKMDWVVEKAVELGVSDLHPIAADRSVLRLTGTRLEKRLEHWCAIVQAASEQCGRNRLMRVHAPVPLAHGLNGLSGPVLFCHPDGAQSFASTLRGVKDEVNFVIGPEGGWSAEELAQARRQALQAVQFGPRVLRTETAGVAIVAAATALLGW
ncbi:MAG: 16S rRNA (uracil(1498)-N(3))-methyltransferase [Castellaniella sp.]|uniref:16S rRNA (uracil(1498)-N(3))-methyltransferase n=1 Tax=Castellaniella sp. TaxID=1955812 RepID=UPI001204AF91|nr:16S rRNA (uracil(1498)-N(3))-methyltransferase [Castellaniella sp.]TAN31079.1 MAG: 16S rRNA (uracil(1498)-N(3))-methyltransferase [Castellaniella sp.]